MSLASACAMQPQALIMSRLKNSRVLKKVRIFSTAGMRNAPLRMRLLVSSPNQRSTKLIHEQ